MIVLLACICVLLSACQCHTEVKLRELKTNELLLLNVAVKGRLFERLTDETDKMQFERNELVNKHKSCLLNVSTTAKACKECVTRRCENRGKQCRMSLDELQKLKDQFHQKDIPGVDFLSTPAVVQEEIREIKETAEKNIMKDVPEKLKPKGKDIMKRIKEGMSVFHHNLEHAVNELPVLLPKIEKRLEDLTSSIDMNDVDDISNTAANQISEVVSDPVVTGIRVNVMNGNQVLQENFPSMMKTMEDTFVRLRGAVGRFVGVVRVQAGTAWKQATVNASNRTDPVGGSQFAGANIMMMPQPFQPETFRPMDDETALFGPGQINNQLRIPTNDMQFPQQQFNNQQFMQQLDNVVMNNNEFQTPQQNAVPQQIWRKKRQAKVPCDQIKSRLYEACHSYHFYCAACMNEKNILEHDCGPAALVAMVAIKELDIQTGSDIVKYRKFVNDEQVIKRVYYDKKSFNKDSGTYARAFITVTIGEEDKVFGTSVLPDIANIQDVGFKLGDELWGILQNDGESVSTRLVQTPEFHTVDPQYLQSDPSGSSAAIFTAMWGAVGLIMYMGFVAISVMV